jgi:hypothetical protein
MVAASSPIRTFADLKGGKLAVAGGAIDKNWLLLQAAMKQDGIDLKSQASIVYGAPPLLAAKTVSGEMDATLNYWNFCAALEAKGFRRVGDRGRPAEARREGRTAWSARLRRAVGDKPRDDRALIADATRRRSSPRRRMGEDRATHRRC